MGKKVLFVLSIFKMSAPTIHTDCASTAHEHVATAAHRDALHSRGNRAQELGTQLFVAAVYQLQ